MVRCVFASVFLIVIGILPRLPCTDGSRHEDGHSSMPSHFLILSSDWPVDELLLELACENEDCIRKRLHFSGARHANRKFMPRSKAILVLVALTASAAPGLVSTTVSA